MGHHEPTFSFAIADDTSDALATAQEFLTLNGYSIDEQDGPMLRARRGEQWASWFSSDMTRLYTELIIEEAEGKLRLSYRITTTGQHMTDEDRAFWKREVDALHTGMTAGEFVDLRPTEATRAQQITGEYRRTAVWAAFIVFVMIVAFGLIADRLGLL